MKSSHDHLLPNNFTIAFQPIVDVNLKRIYSYEALIRGKNDEPAAFVLTQINGSDFLALDQQGRVLALRMAAKLGIDCFINLNFQAESLQDSDKYIVETLKILQQNGLSEKNLIIEITEQGIIDDYNKFINCMNKFRGSGIKVAIDDFGAGYSGLNLLVNFQPDMIKLDMQLIRNINSNGPRQAVVKAIIQVCDSLGIDLIAEGVEQVEEYQWLRKHGLYLFQGFLFAKPGFESLPDVNYPDY